MNKIYCPVCKGKKIGILYKNITDRVFNTKEIYDLYLCYSCGLIINYPQKPPIYSDSSGEEPLFLSDLIKLKKIKRFFYNSKKSFLDVGSGSGKYLEWLKKQGYSNVMGIEPHRLSYEEASKKGLKILKTSLEKANLKPESIECALAHHVIEHTKNPEIFLKKVWTILNKGGRFLCVTPNGESFLHRLRRENWYPLGLHSHYYLFSVRSISAVMRNVGFRIVKVRIYPFSLKFALKTSIARNRKGFWLIVRTFLLPFLFLLNLVTGKYGEEIWVYAEKK